MNKSGPRVILFLLVLLLSMGAVMFASNGGPSAEADGPRTLVVDCLGDPAAGDDTLDVDPNVGGIQGDDDDADDPAILTGGSAEEDCTGLSILNNTNPCSDAVDKDCSLRWAVWLANTNRHHTGAGAHPDIITFKPGLTGVIQLDGDNDNGDASGDNTYLVLTDSRVINGVNTNNTKIIGPTAVNVQTDPLITVDCDPFVGGNSRYAFIIKTGQNEIRNLNIVRCNSNGLVGNDPAAILIGGESPVGVEAALLIGGESADGNLIVGNTIGTNRSGTDCDDDFGNTSNTDGIIIDDGGDGNEIGRTGVENMNVISCNDDDGIFIDEDDSDGNIIRNNRIGTNWAGTGTPDMGNDDGIEDQSSSGTIIRENLISGNDDDGIDLDGVANLVLIQGNIIGANVTGTLPLQNDEDGIDINDGDVSDVVIGCDPSGHTAVGPQVLGTPNIPCNNLAPLSVGATRNLISGNGDGDDDDNGIEISGDTIVVAGNFIGTDISGNAQLSNDGDGVHVHSFANNVLIGGRRVNSSTNLRCNIGPCNVIGGNEDHGIQLEDDADGTLIQGNNIGLGANGFAEVGNLGDGINDASDSGTIIGSSSGDLTSPFDDGTTPGACTGVCNVIAFNSSAGVAVAADNSTNTIIRKNTIFSNGSLGIDLDDDDVIQCPAEDDIVIDPVHLAGHSATPAANDSFDACPVILTGENDGTVSGVITPLMADEARVGAFGRVDIYIVKSPESGHHGEGMWWIATTDVDDFNQDPVDYLHTFGTVICIDGPAILTATVSELDENNLRTSEFGPNFNMQEISVCGGMLDITVDLEAWIGTGCAAPLYCETIVTITGPTTESQTLPTGEGTASFVVPPGTYSYTITHRGHLSECGSTGFVAQQATVTVNEFLTGGDVFTATGLGVINIFDLSAIAADIGNPYDPASDINGDGVVDILDLSLAAANFLDTDTCP